MALRTTRASQGAAAALVVLALAACSSGADQDKKGSDASSSSASVSPQQRLTQAKQVMDQAASMRLKLTSSGVPKQANGVLGGDGVGTHAPAFKGTLKAQVASTQLDIPVTSVGGKVWAKLPIWPDARVVQPKDYGAPDPAMLFSTDQGLSTLLAKTSNPAYGEQKREGGDVVQLITGKVAGQEVVNVLAVGKPSATYDATYAITANNQVRSMALTGSFYNEGTATYTLGLDQYGEKVDIAPPA